MADMGAVFALAAKGNIDAQAAMLDRMVFHANEHMAFSEGFMGVIEMWARMLATHGRPEDISRLAGVLVFRGAMHRHAGRPTDGQSFEDQGLGMLRQLANAGYAMAAARLEALADLISNDLEIPAAIMLSEAPQATH